VLVRARGQHGRDDQVHSHDKVQSHTYLTGCLQGGRRNQAKPKRAMVSTRKQRVSTKPYQRRASRLLACLAPAAEPRSANHATLMSANQPTAAVAQARRKAARISFHVVRTVGRCLLLKPLLRPKRWRRRWRRATPSSSSPCEESSCRICEWRNRVIDQLPHVCRRTVTMPYKKSDFNEALQDKYKAAIASAAGAPVDNVDIISITEKRRRAGSVDVETKVLCLLTSPPSPESGPCAAARWRQQRCNRLWEIRLPLLSCPLGAS